MKVRFKKLDNNSTIPEKAHESDAGFDLRCTRAIYGTRIVTYGTGIAVEIPRGYVGLVFPRSSIYKKSLNLSNSVGVIDSGYRGEIMFKFNIIEEDPCMYEIGDRIGQLIIIPYPEIEFEEADELSDSDRGEGGYGSTGK